MAARQPQISEVELPYEVEATPQSLKRDEFSFQSSELSSRILHPFFSNGGKEFLFYYLLRGRIAMWGSVLM